MSAAQFFIPHLTATVAGIAIPGAQFEFLQSGTTTPLTVYSDSGLTTPRTNPVVCNGAGALPITYLDNTKTYRLRIYDNHGALLDGGDIDPFIPGTVPDASALQPYADAAAASASAASGSASAAATSETNAASSETAAAASAASASSSATTASAAATAASGSIAAVPNATAHAATRSALSVLGTSSGPAFLAESGREGTFVWSSANLSSQVTADTAQAIYVPPSSDTTGASGAWVRKFSGLASVKWFGAVGDNVNDDTTAFQAALASGYAIFAPSGTYKITSTLTLGSGAYLVGAGQTKTIIQSNIVGGSLFNTSSLSVAFPYVAHMRLNGNNLTGASGSGHCFNYVNPNSNGVSTSTWSPQNCQLEYLEIYGFRGSDQANYTGGKVAAAGIIQLGTIQVTCKHVYITNCGHGFYMQSTQNCRIRDCVATTCDKAAYFGYANVNLSITDSDLVNCGLDGATDAGYPELMPGSGLFISYKDQGTLVSGTKMKNYIGTALIVIGWSQIIFTGACSLRGDAQVSGVVNKTMLITAGSNVTVNGKTVFNPVTTVDATQPYQTIEVSATQNSPTICFTAEDCVFLDVSGQPIAYNIRLHGNAAARSIKAKIVNVQFGSPASNSAASTVTNDITVDTMTFAPGSQIGANYHTAQTNVTRTACVAFGASVTMNGLSILPGKFDANGGTITANYSGVTPVGGSYAASAQPSSGTYTAGDIVMATAPASGSPWAWLRLTTGSSHVAGTDWLSMFPFSGVVGYTTGSGGAITQVTSRTTGVTLNKPCGQITLVSAAGSATWQTFTVTNSQVAATDVIRLNQKSGTDKYMIHVTNVSAGSFDVTYATTGGTTTEQPVFNFAIIKAANA